MKSKRIKKVVIEKTIKIIEEKFRTQNLDNRRKLFEYLESWALNTLNEEQRDIFLRALYNAPSTQDIQLTIGLEKALDKINFRG